MDLTNLSKVNSFQEATEEYLNFLDDTHTERRIYIQKAEELIKNNGTRLIVNLNDIRQQLPERADRLFHCFVEEIVCLENAATKLINRIDPDYAKGREFFVGLEGNFDSHHVNLRSLKSNLLGKLVCCEGIVSKCLLVCPKVTKSEHYRSATKKILKRNYIDYDATHSTTHIFPIKDDCSNSSDTEFGLSTYNEHHLLTIQELPEAAPVGELPQCVDIIADEDLADACKLGDRVRVIGLFRVIPKKHDGLSSGFFKSVIIANNIQFMSKETYPNFDPQDIDSILKISKTEGVFELLARSLAPSIWGYEEVKKAILCLLLSGSEKVLNNQTRLRGDINVLLVGDPSVAKSQLLRYVLNAAPKAIATTGNGTNSAGLTAAVITDPSSGERRLEAGPMVLADRGVVCIDEFDKISDTDRTTIHEVMDKGRVTIAKADINAKLNARCSVLAAANPVYGRYDTCKSAMVNIGMQDSLLSRFDLVFVLMDECDPERDMEIAGHIERLHRYRAPGENNGSVVSLIAETVSTSDVISERTFIANETYVKNKEWCAENNKRILSMQFMKKYIHMAKAVKPILTPEASDYITECYSKMRSFNISKTDQERTMPVTARQLETLIRLSTAIAKTRFSKTVERSDAENAYDLLHYAYFKVKPGGRLQAEVKKNQCANENGEKSDDGDEGYVDDVQENDSDMETDEVIPVVRGVKRRLGDTQVTDNRMNSDSPMESMDPADASEKAGRSSAKKSRKEPVDVAIAIDRYKAFRRYIRKAFENLEKPDGTVSLSKILDSVQEQAGSQRFSEGELQAGLEKLSDENIVIIADDKITLI